MLASFTAYCRLIAPLVLAASFGFARDAHASWSDASLRVADLERVYRVYRPATAKPGAPMVVVLHGGGQSMGKIFSGPGGTRQWTQIADREGAILLAPNATQLQTGDARSDNQTWNDLRTAGTPKHVDDVAFIAQMVRAETTRQQTNAQRVFITGSSNGGMMTFRMLIELPELFAAGAVFIANMPAELASLAQPKRPTPLMIANGTRDPLMPWDGGAVSLDANRGSVASAQQTVRWWVQANRAQAQASRAELLADNDPSDGCRIQLEQHAASAEGAPVWFYTAQGGGHTMPSINHRLPDTPIVRRFIGTSCRDVEGAELAWAFMSPHTKGDGR
jgi:polyhydroxybutyrate depolymerase